MELTIQALKTVNTKVDAFTRKPPIDGVTIKILMIA